MKKTLILIILLLVVLGGIFLFFNHPTSVASIINPQSAASVEPTPTSIPTPIPLDTNTNLKDYLENLTPESYSNDYQSLKTEVKTF